MWKINLKGQINQRNLGGGTGGWCAACGRFWKKKKENKWGICGFFLVKAEIREFVWFAWAQTKMRRTGFEPSTHTHTTSTRGGWDAATAVVSAARSLFSVHTIFVEHPPNCLRPKMLRNNYNTIICGRERWTETSSLVKRYKVSAGLSYLFNFMCIATVHVFAIILWANSVLREQLVPTRLWESE